MAHQRVTETISDSSAHHIRGVLPTESVQKFRKGACENCGALTHKTKECLERPRKVGAKWTGKDIGPDEFVQEAALGFEGKRDRWAGYNAEEYAEVVEQWRRAEEERKALKKQNEREGDETKDSSEEEDSDEEEKYAESVDMPGQKVDLKTRMTVRNLRLREDTAKYLEDLNADPSQYDPKTRSMRKPVAAKDAFVPEEEAQSQETLFAWEAANKKLFVAGKSAHMANDAESPPEEGATKKAKVDPDILKLYDSKEISKSSQAKSVEDDLL